MQSDMGYGPYDLANEHLKDYFYYSLQQPKSQSQDPTISTIFHHHDPDIKCLALLKQVSFETSDSYCISEFKSSVDFQNIKSEFFQLHINVCGLLHHSFSLCLTNLDFSSSWLTKTNFAMYEFNNDHVTHGPISFQSC